jgi:hypothetical protein
MKTEEDFNKFGVKDALITGLILFIGYKGAKAICKSAKSAISKLCEKPAPEPLRPFMAGSINGRINKIPVSPVRQDPLRRWRKKVTTE